MYNTYIMNGKELLLLTVQVSLIIQLLIGTISAGGIFIKLKKEDMILRDILIIETIVQFIEATWYIYIAYAMKNIKENTIASRRYIDWVITTPIMLLATVMFMEYDIGKKQKKIVTAEAVIQSNKRELIKIGAYNFGMLAFGYLGETNVLNKYISVPIGAVFFGLSFNEIWKKFGNKTEKTRKLFYFLISVWSLYGVAAVMPIIPKNVMYNCLDIVSKNFYGLYIFYEIIKLKQ